MNNQKLTNILKRLENANKAEPDRRMSASKSQALEGIMLDSFSLSAEEIKQVVNRMPKCSFRIRLKARARELTSASAK